MNKLKEITTAITHAGNFHTDDVISTAFIKFFNPDVKIIRVNAYEDTPKEDEIVYDIGLGKFDHHQEVRRVDENGIPYCAFGLLWEEYGRDYLQELHFTNIEAAFNKFKEMYVTKINIGDNTGYVNVEDFLENYLIIKCNLLWFEKKDQQDNNKQFMRALMLGTSILKNWTRNIYRIIEKGELK